MSIEIIEVSPDTYGYLVICDETKEAVVVDPGKAKPVIDAVAKHGVKLIAVWNTNHHLNHSGGNEELKKKYEGLKVYCHPKDVTQDPYPEGRTRGVTDTVEDGDRLTVGKLSAKVMHVPGHTMGGLAFYIASEDAVFTGEVMHGCGTTRNFENNVDVLMKSMNDTLARLPRRTKIYPGREWTLRNIIFTMKVDPTNEKLRERYAKVKALRDEGKPSVPFTLEEEIDTNPFLRTEDKALHDHVLGEYFEPDEPFYVFSRCLQMRERGINSPRADKVGPDPVEPEAEWAKQPVWNRYEWHDKWRRHWHYWMEMHEYERRRAVHDPLFWNCITDDQKQNFLIEADWQELRHVRGLEDLRKHTAWPERERAPEKSGREIKIEQLWSMAKMQEYLDMTHVQIYWLMSTRKLPGWLVDGTWRFDKHQLDRYVDDFGGLEALKRDIEDQIAKHRAAQNITPQRPGAPAKKKKEGEEEEEIPQIGA